jgi:hypothetical protein
VRELSSFLQAAPSRSTFSPRYGHCANPISDWRPREESGRIEREVSGVKSSLLFGFVSLAGVGLLLGCEHPPESAGPPKVTAGPVAPETTPAAKPDRAADASAPPPATPFAGPAMARNPQDLDWLGELARVLTDEPATLEQVRAFLGEDAGPDMHHVGGRMVRARSGYFETIALYATPHVPVALDMTPVATARPSRAALGSALGPLQLLPQLPGDQGGPKVALTRQGKMGTLHVVAELDAQSQAVAGIHVDVESSEH